MYGHADAAAEASRWGSNPHELVSDTAQRQTTGRRARHAIAACSMYMASRLGADKSEGEGEGEGDADAVGVSERR